MKKIRLFVTLFASFLLIAPIVNAKVPLAYSSRSKKQAGGIGNGVELQPTKKGKTPCFGTIVVSVPKLSVKDLKKLHDVDIKRLKKQHDFQSVQIVAAGDDYWYYSLQSKEGLYGVASPEGNIIIPPKYTTCYYCPSLPEETETFSVTDFGIQSASLFRLYHPRTRGSFLVTYGEQPIILSTTGQLQMDLPSSMYVYYHGYIMSGVIPNDIFFSSDESNLLSMKVFNRDGMDNVLFVTSDGRQVCYPTQIGIKIDNSNNGEQPVYSYQYDEYRVVRQGAFLLNDPSSRIPVLFGDITYNYDGGKWLVRPNAMENAQVYNPSIHNAVSYQDSGEKMFYQGDYQGCLDFYNSLRDSVDVSPWNTFYTAAALFRGTIGRYNVFAKATNSFENINDGSYTQYYNQRMDMKHWPENDIPAWKKSLRLLEEYKNTASPQLYSETTEKMCQQLKIYIGNYENLQSRYAQAINTLDGRIRNMKQKQMEEEAANQAMANAVAGIIFGSLDGLFSGGGSSKSVTSGSTSGRISKGGSSSASSSNNNSNNNSSDSGVKEVHIKCKACGGSGKCKVCGGSGRSKSKLGMDISCSCHGGKCSICDGKGYKVEYSSK